MGGAASAVPRLLEERPDYCRVMQFDWSILDPRPDTPGFSLHYGVLGRAFGWLRTALAADPALQRRWSMRWIEISVTTMCSRRFCSRRPSR